MSTIRYLVLRVALVAALMATFAEGASAASEKEQSLINVLQSDSPRAEKAITCKRLAVYGTKDAVPALAALLGDEQLTSWARIALEAIPGPEADQALREAMGKVQGRVLVGVINSIGVRHDAAAVDVLIPRLADTDAEVAAAAAVALGHVGGEAATAALRKSLSGPPEAVRSAAAEGCILSAEKLLAAGKADEAAKLYDEVRAAEVPKQRVVEATRGAILARGPAGVPLLVEQLRSEDKVMRAIGLQTARELQGPEVTKALVAELRQAAPDRQAPLLLALADRGDASALPAVLQAAKDGPKPARIVALGALGRIGNASCVPVLLDLAAESDADLAQAAKKALEDLPGKEVDANLAAGLAQAKGGARLALIELLGRRRIEAATPGLIQATDDADAAVRAAALAALGSTVGPGDVAFLIGRVVTPKRAEDAKAAEGALLAACIRMPDADACAEKLVAAASGAPAEAKAAIVEVLGAMGGKTALEALAVAAKDADPRLQDAASRLLGEWMSMDAAPVLLDLSKTAPDAKYKVRALRGYLRLARQFAKSDRERADMCRAALDAAPRDADKKLVLEAIVRHPSVDMLKLAVELSKTSSLKDEAARTALAIAQKIGGESAEVQKLLAEVGHVAVKIEIVKAEYGAGAQWKDVTEILQKAVRGFPLIVLPSSNYNEAFGGDPAPNVVKQLKVQYTIDGKPGEATFSENATVLLPIPK